MSAPLAPLCVPVELSRAEKGAPGPRWFRLALGINEDGLRLRSPVPEELAEGPIAVRLHLPEDPDPARDVVFILRTGALFPVYRTFSLLEQLKGRVHVPTVLFYPGDLDGAAGLRFMGVLDAEHNYRPKIF